jgi:hypothetical protein
MERRSKKRIGAKFEASLFCGNLFYSGTVLNLTEKSMFINTKKSLPRDSMFVVVLRECDQLVNVIGQVKRHAKSHINSDGIGIELLSPSAGYLKFVNRLQFS